MKVSYEDFKEVKKALKMSKAKMRVSMTFLFLLEGFYRKLETS